MNGPDEELAYARSVSMLSPNDELESLLNAQFLRLAAILGDIAKNSARIAEALERLDKREAGRGATLAR